MADRCERGGRALRGEVRTVLHHERVQLRHRGTRADVRRDGCAGRALDDRRPGEGAPDAGRRPGRGRVAADTGHRAQTGVLLHAVRDPGRQLWRGVAAEVDRSLHAVRRGRAHGGPVARRPVAARADLSHAGVGQDAGDGVRGRPAVAGPEAGEPDDRARCGPGRAGPQRLGPVPHHEHAATAGPVHCPGAARPVGTRRSSRACVHHRPQVRRRGRRPEPAQQHRCPCG